ncbi:MAG: hypothetical protein F6J95_016095 [Leptolyngbya sp. SIO1E4]|nr:hypothetical protein [Leptolyngbya sp. SIO1E4]
MNKTVTQSPTEALQAAMKLAQDATTQDQAHAAFNELYEDLRYDNPQVATMVQMLWREYVASQRSVAFWQELCQVEKHLSERITENHLQLRQNYLRLMQEQ